MCDCSERPEFWDRRIRTARKPHICVECRRTIRIGECYQYLVSKVEGQISDDHLCLDCKADWETLESLPFDALPECYCLGELSKLIGEAIDSGDLEPSHPLAVKYFGEPSEDDDEDDEDRSWHGIASQSELELAGQLAFTW